MSAKRKSSTTAPAGAPKSGQPNLGNQAKPWPIIPSVNLESFNPGRSFTVIALALLLLVIGVVWSGPGINVDLFTSLAGGRDVAAGHLGGPDNWSFVTGGRVWLNQNWGGDLLFYLCQHNLGFNALLWVKAMLIAACALFAFLAARRRKVPWVIALAATALVIISIRNYIDLRPNLITLVFAPLELWLLYRTRERPGYIWLVAGIMLLWANLHGGFIFGLGIMALWTVCLLIPAVITNGLAGFKRNWRLIAATILAVLLSGFVNPFGIINLTMPFLMLAEKYWRNVAEWQPIFGENFAFGTVWEFLLISSGIIVLSLYRLIIIRRNTLAAVREQPLVAKERRLTQLVGKPDPVPASNAGVIVFELLLFLILVLMALESRRFIPLALVLLIPVLGMQLWWLTSLARSRWVLIILGLMILIITGSQISHVLRYYNPDNPLSNPEPFFEKMNLAYNFFPVKLAGFVNDNQLEGNVYCNWEWEGYLHWYCPSLKIFVGGRAQQIYREAEYQLYSEILSSRTPWDELKRLKVHLVACSYNGIFTDLINLLITKGNWVCIFNDNQSCLLADPSWPQTRGLVDQALQGRLVFRSRTDGLLSQASSFLSPAAHADYSKAIAILERAVQLRPLSKGYMALANFVFSKAKQAPEVVAFLAREELRLSKMSLNHPDGQEILISRFWILSILMQYYTHAHLDKPAELVQQAFQKVQLNMAIMHLQWDYQKSQTSY